MNLWWSLQSCPVSRLTRTASAKALTRLQHLPYSWNASPIRSDEKSISEDYSHSSNLASATAAQTPVKTLSAGVIEFGAPGVIEFGAIAEAAVMSSSAVESAVMSVTNPVESFVASVAETSVPQSPDSFETDESFEVGHCFAEVGESWFQSVAGESDSNLSPVFDRYTWIALGRDVPPGRVPTSSALTLRQMSDGRATPVDQRRVVVTNPVSLGTHGSITVTRTTDDEIITSLSGHPVCHHTGTFFLSHAPAISRLSDQDTRAEVEALPQVNDHSLVSAGEFDPASDLAWHDGQLIFSSAVPEPDSWLPVDETPDEMQTSGETEQSSLRLEVASVASEELEAQENTATCNEREPDKFFTLPVDVNSIRWDRRIEHADFDGVLPLAESLASLRDEVTSFQQTGRTILHDDSDAGARDTVTASTPEPTTGGSLVARAKRRLDEMAVLQSIQASVSHENWTAASSIERTTPASTADELTSDGAGTSHTKPRFSQLFTSLRRMRHGTAENDFR